MTDLDRFLIYVSLAIVVGCLLAITRYAGVCAAALKTIAGRKAGESGSSTHQ